MPSPKDPTATVVEQQRDLLGRWPFDDTRDVEDAQRGLVARLDPASSATPTGEW